MYLSMQAFSFYTCVHNYVHTVHNSILSLGLPARNQQQSYNALGYVSTHNYLCGLYIVHVELQGIIVFMKKYNYYDSSLSNIKVLIHK